MDRQTNTLASLQRRSVCHSSRLEKKTKKSKKQCTMDPPVDKDPEKITEGQRKVNMGTAIGWDSECSSSVDPPL